MTPEIVQIFVIGTALTIATPLFALAAWALLSWLVRHHRLSAMRHEVRQLRDWAPRTRRPEAVTLASCARGLDALERTGRVLLTSAERARVPAPPPPSGSETERELLERVGSTLGTRRVALVAAGGDAAVGAWLNLGRADFDQIQHGVRALVDSGLPQVALGLVQGGAKSLLISGAREVGGALIENGFDVAAAGAALQDNLVDSWEHVTDAATALGGAFDDVSAGDVHAHIPVMTILTSSYREMELLAANKTTAERAAVHVAIDVGSAAGAGFAGAKAGALIGSFLLPGVGAAIGAALGGVAGAVTGRAVAHEIRIAPLHAAVSAYQDLAREATEAQRASALRMLDGIRTEADEAQTAYARAMQPLRSAVIQVTSTPRSRASVDALWGVRRAGVRDEIERRLEAVRGAQPVNTEWTRALGFGTGAGAATLRREAEQVAREATQAWNHARRPIGRSVAQELELLAALPWTSDQASALNEARETVAAEIRTRVGALDEGTRSAHSTFRTGIGRVLAVGEEHALRHRAAGTRFLAKLQTAELEVNRHKSALGLD